MLMMRRCTFTSVTHPVIVKMSTDNEGNSDYQKMNFVMNKKLFKDQEYKPGTEN